MINNELLKRGVPDFFKGVDSLQDWESLKCNLKDLLLKEEYGYPPEKLSPKITTEPQSISFAGKGSWESVFFTFEKDGKSHTVRCELILPKGVERAPVFLLMDFEARVPSKYFPTEEILDGGFGIMSFCYESVTADNNDFSSGLCGLFKENDAHSFGKITIWAYMASACMDYLCTREDVDSNNVAIIGHSRLGKTALLASALDERFVLTCSNNSGCCGAALSRGKRTKNESIRAITTTFPQWFCQSFLKYSDNEVSLPFDQHMLVALIAPRHLMIGCAQEDYWADNEGQFLSCYLSSKIWELYGKSGLRLNGDCMPRVSDSLTEGELGFYIREGSHFLSRYDWNKYMMKFKEILKG